MREIVRMAYGSHLFGTNVEGSDRDFKAVYLPSGDDILLQQAKQSRRNQSPAKPSQPEGEDIEFLTLQHYLQLLCQGQTLALDMAFVPEEYYVGPEPLGAEWYAVRRHLQSFLHSGIGIFTGFAQSQARRYSHKADRLSAVEAVHEFFVMAARVHGPSTRIVQVKLDLMSLVCDHSQDIVRFVMIPNRKRNGAPVEHFECCDRKMPLGATVREAGNTYRKVVEFYGKRAKLAQQMGGQDWKALYHAVRIVREAEELLLEEKITFPRPEAELLLKIRRGELPHENVMILLEEGLKDVERARGATGLPKVPDHALAERLVTSFYGSQVMVDRNNAPLAQSG